MRSSFTNDEPAYTYVVSQLRAERDAWTSAWDSGTKFGGVDEAIRQISGLALAPYDALVADLRARYSTDEEMFEQLTLTATAQPARDAGYDGPEWQGCYISARPDGTWVWSESPFADLTGWHPIEGGEQPAAALTQDETTGLWYDAEHWYLPDQATIVAEEQDNPGYFRDGAGNLYFGAQPLGLAKDDNTGLWYDARHWYLTEDKTTIVAEEPGSPGYFRDGAGNLYFGAQRVQAPADPTEMHYDEETGRYRRWDRDSGAFEYYHDRDQVWERYDEQNGAWERYHSPEHGWLRYDHASDHWLDPQDNQWRKHEHIGAPAPAAGAPPAQPAEAAAQPGTSAAVEMVGAWPVTPPAERAGAPAKPTAGTGQEPARTVTVSELVEEAGQDPEEIFARLVELGQ
jgi:hypothetical protein